MKIIFIILTLFTVSITGQTQTYTYGPKNADLKASVWYNYNYSPLYEGTLEGSTNAQIDIGVEHLYKIHRAVYQWDLSNLNVPQGANLKEVIITYSYYNVIATRNLILSIHALDKALDDNPIDWDNLYLGMQYDAAFGTYIQQNSGPPNQILTYSSSDVFFDNDFAKWKIKIGEAIQNGKLVLGLRLIQPLENIDGNVDLLYRLPSGSIKLSLVYSIPQESITVRQKLSNGTEFGQIGHWETNQWQSYPSGHTFSFGLNNTEFLQSDINTSNNEKFNNWNDNVSTTFLNFNDYLVGNNVTQLISNFNPIDEINLNVSAENSSTQYDSVELKDPWLRDDNSDSKGIRNRGTNAIWHSYASPYNITTSGEHQGVFLG